MNPVKQNSNAKINLSLDDALYVKNMVVAAADTKMNIHMPPIKYKPIISSQQSSKGKSNKQQSTDKSKEEDDNDDNDEEEEEVADPMRKQVEELLHTFIDGVFEMARFGMVVDGEEMSKKFSLNQILKPGQELLDKERDAEKKRKRQEKEEKKRLLKRKKVEEKEKQLIIEKQQKEKEDDDNEIRVEYVDVIDEFDLNLNQRLRKLYGQVDDLTAQVSTLRKTASKRLLQSMASFANPKEEEEQKEDSNNFAIRAVQDMEKIRTQFINKSTGINEKNNNNDNEEEQEVKKSNTTNLKMKFMDLEELNQHSKQIEDKLEYLEDSYLVAMTQLIHLKSKVINISPDIDGSSLSIIDKK